jgi:hypothetical protein
VLSSAIVHLRKKDKTRMNLFLQNIFSVLKQPLGRIKRNDYLQPLITIAIIREP